MGIYLLCITDREAGAAIKYLSHVDDSNRGVGVDVPSLLVKQALPPHFNMATMAPTQILPYQMKAIRNMWTLVLSYTKNLHTLINFYPDILREWKVFLTILRCYGPYSLRRWKS